MNKLSDKQVSKLNEAIDKTMDILDSVDKDPNRAIVKVAQDMGLTADYIPVLVSAYNNGAQYATREKGTTISEKTAKFKLADENIITNALYNNSNEKSAGYCEVADNFFDYPVGVLVNNNEEKYSSTLYSPVVSVKRASVNNDRIFRDEQNLVDSINSIKDDVSMTKQAALDNYDDSIKDLAYYLRRVDAPSVPFAIKLASMAYGTDGAVIIKEAAMRFSLPLNNKRSEPVVPISSQFYTECNSCLKKLAEYNNICDEELGILDTCSRALKPVVKQRLKSIYKQSSISNASPAYFFEKKKDEIKQAAKIFPEALSGPNHDARGGKLMNSDVSGLESLVRPQWRDLNVYEHNIMRSLDDPEHEAKLRDIAVSANLTDLINTDEYLSDKDPEEVIDAYNELMEIAPEIHNKKPLLRAALRQYMESGGIDVQSLGLIGDIGRKTESRVDEAKKLLSENVNKMLENEEKMRWDKQREQMRTELTVSEGRKDRMFRAEQSRKDRSNQRQVAEARKQYEIFKAKLQHQEAANKLKLQKELAIADAKAQRARDIDKLITDSLNPNEPMSIPNINAAMGKARDFNNLSNLERAQYVAAAKRYGLDPSDIATRGSTTLSLQADNKLPSGWSGDILDINKVKFKPKDTARYYSGIDIGDSEDEDFSA